MPLARDGTTFSLQNDVRNNFLPKVEFSHLFSFAKKMDCLWLSSQKIRRLKKICIRLYVWKLVMTMSCSMRHSPRFKKQCRVKTDGYTPGVLAVCVQAKFISLTINASILKWSWQSKVCRNIKVFTWLAFKDRFNSRNILRKRCIVVNGDYNCVLYDLHYEETTYHLIFNCPFNNASQNHMGIYQDHLLNFFLIGAAREHFRYKFFMEIITVSTWKIWKQRNVTIFRICSLLFLEALLQQHVDASQSCSGVQIKDFPMA